MLKVYLDTSILSVAEFDDSGERKAVTLELLDRIDRRDGIEAFISPVVETEIRNTSDAQRRQVLLRRLHSTPVILLNPALQGELIGRLVEAYLQRRCVPPSKLEDAFHVAAAVAFGLDVLATWNYRHLAGVEREKVFQTVHNDFGLTTALRLVTPWELTR